MTSAADEDDGENFYKDLASVMKKIPKRDARAIMTLWHRLGNMMPELLDHAT